MNWENIRSKLNIKNVVIGLLAVLSLLIVVNLIFFRPTDNLNLEDENIVRNSVVKINDNLYSFGLNEVVKYNDGTATYRTNGYEPSQKELENIAKEMGIPVNSIKVYVDPFITNLYEQQDPNLVIKDVDRPVLEEY